MCGICGFLKFNGPAGEEDRVIIHAMNRKLFHRGPDAQGVLLSGNLAFGFSRLSIIGLSNGMQPIWNEDETVVLVCNGEIFNYIELREQLQAQGHRFRTDSDVEVIIHLYEEYGYTFLNRMNGQFAFALYDTKKQSLFCCRDQMGIVPFFYTFTRDTFIFGSEIKAILEHPLVVREVDLVGLDQVFTFAGLISPRTMFGNISSLENGHYLRVDSGGSIEKKEYWDLIYPVCGRGGDCRSDEEDRPEAYYIERLEELLDTAIRFRLRSDVPSGFYLSGGLDSSLIAMKIDQLAPGLRKEAFSIDFIESGISESVYQRLVAKESHANLNQKVFFYEDISKRLQQSVYHSECPVKETYNTASLSLSETVRSKGIKVILSGEGADEFFAGYVGYRFDKMRAMNPLREPVSPAEEALRGRIWGDKNFFYETDFFKLGVLKKNLYSEEVNRSFAEIDCLNHPVINKDRLANRNVLHKRAYIDYKIRLVDHLVSDHGDRMALANSVEVRYPFMDKDLVEFSAAIPPGLKLKDFSEKFILREIARKLLPASVVDREKFGFVAPGSPYLLRKNIDYINEILSGDRIKKQGIFNPDYVEKLRKAYSADGFSVNAPFESDLLITVITFGIFLDTFFT